MSSPTRVAGPPAYPARGWYVAATSSEVTSEPLGRRALDTSLVLYRATDGEVAVLEDRDAHRPFPLSLGHLEGDLIVSSYSGFAYDTHGTCVRVPTQVEVPYDARVRAFPTCEQDGLIWVWFAEPGLAELHHPPTAPWLVDANWSTVGEEWTTQANFLLLHENFADITHVAVVHPEIAPPVLTSGPVPLLEVEVTETSVSFQREYPPAPLAPWHADLLDVSADDLFAQREEGRFVSPGLWIDSWDVVGGKEGSDAIATFRFTHAVTPVDATSTRHIWRVSRNFAPEDRVSGELLPRFVDYYQRVRGILETMQQILSLDGPRGDVSVASDVAAIQVRKIVGRMVADERWT